MGRSVARESDGSGGSGTDRRIPSDVAELVSAERDATIWSGGDLRGRRWAVRPGAPAKLAVPRPCPAWCAVQHRPINRGARCRARACRAESHRYFMASLHAAPSWSPPPLHVPVVVLLMPIAIALALALLAARGPRTPQPATSTPLPGSHQPPPARDVGLILSPSRRLQLASAELPPPRGPEAEG